MAQEVNFEKELNRLKEIVSLIQQKELSLDESLKLYEEGNKIVKLLNEELKIDEGFLYSTVKLSESQIDSIEEAVGKKLGHKVELKNVIDERLIGGVRVVIHDHVFDGSIKFKLETLKNNLKERRTN